ncbi:MFS transporter [Streptosporangium sp. G11]|uniref:MFS transporter n=1 Tax=Streptosporangium sp. G11 TaxID=3436926 RepID=UPI003EBF8CD0
MHDGIRRFVVIWAAQLLSIIGSSLTGFVLGVWVYQRNGSATEFVLIMLCAVLPEVLLSPLAGALADRWDRRRMLMAADAGAAAVTGALALLLVYGSLEVWHVYVITVAGAVFGTFHMAAYHAMMPLIMPQRHLGRANGLMQVADSVKIAAPLLAGTLLVTVGVTGVVVIDLVTFLVTRVVMFAVRLPREVTRPGAAAAPEPLRGDLLFGWRYLRARRGLFQLVMVLAAYNLFFGMSGVLVQPLILSFGSAAVLGALMFAGGAGVFAGGLALSAWGGPRRRVRGVAAFVAVGGVLLALHSLAPSPWLIAVVAPAFLFTLPFVQGTGMTVLQIKTDPAALGRVLSTVRALTQTATVLTYLAAGPLADRVFEPMLAPGGALSGTLGAVIGTGEGRGIAAIFLITGLCLVLLAPLAYLQPRLRKVESELPDAEDVHAPPEPASESASKPASKPASEPVTESATGRGAEPVAGRGEAALGTDVAQGDSDAALSRP